MSAEKHNSEFLRGDTKFLQGDTKFSRGDTILFGPKPGITAEQRDQTRQTLDALMGALKDQNVEAVHRAKQMPGWCKHCAVQYSLSTAGVNKELGCFQLLCPNCRELIIQVRTNDSAALRFLARLFITSQSANEESNNHQGEIDHCVWAFQQHDYQRCLDLAVPLVSETRCSYFVQILLISAQRMGLELLVEQTAQFVLGPTANHSPWEAVLMKLTLGLLGHEEAMKFARSDEDRCRVYFYTAARLITQGDKRRAKELLKLCLRFEINCIEQTLASSELQLT